MRNKILVYGMVMLMMASCTSENSKWEEPVIEDIEENLPSAAKDEPLDWELTGRVELSAEQKAIMAGINEFSHNIIKEIAMQSKTDAGFCISPVSASIYLGMLANATQGTFRDQILDAFGAEDIEHLSELCEKMLHYLPYEGNGSSISINNRFWVSDAYRVPEDFESLMRKVFNAEVSHVDFHNPSTVPEINKWVSDNTKGLVNLLLDDDWTRYESLVMTNANTVYFKGNWASEFNVEDTRIAKFHGKTGDLEVKTMYQTLITAYASNDKVQLLNMDFDGPVNSMELYLPAEGIGIGELLEILTPEMQRELKGNYELCEVSLSLPSFEIKTDMDLKGILENIGMPTFENLDFSPMGLGCQPVSMTHKAAVKIDEKGAEMAAMTGGWLGLHNPDDSTLRKVTMNFNRPFVYIVRNGVTDAVLMAGTVMHPQ